MTLTLSAPRGHLLTGHLPEFSRDLLGFLTRCARDHGDIVPLRIGPLRAYLLSRPDLVEHVLLTHSKDFRKSPAYRLILSRVVGDGLVTSDGEVWRRQRRLVQPAFHRERIAAYAEAMVDRADRAVAHWREGEVRDVHGEMMRLTLEIVCRALFKADVSDAVRDVGEALSVAREEANTRLNTLLFLVPAFVPTPGNLRLKRAVRRLDRVVYGLIEQRRAKGDGDDDLLGMLLRARDEGSGMTDRQLRDELMTLFLAGHETTAIALTWAFYLLAQHPEAEATLHAELASVLRGGRPTADDAARLVYTEHVIWETLRLYPPVIALGRQALRDCEIGGVPIRKGSILLLSQWVLHRDPRYFTDPERFDPGRWADGLAARLPRFAYFPFGGGPRSCIGASFAMLEAVLVLATIAHRYRLRIAPEERVGLDPSATLRPKGGLRMVLAARHHPTA